MKRRGGASAGRDVPRQSRGAHFDDEGGPCEDRLRRSTVRGIDLHRRRSVIVRMTPEGEQLGWVRLDNDPVALGLELAKAGSDPEVVLEATYGWY